ncbi:hypothetical protein V5799_006485 [Amblyomma americanum]|uniref:Major facilitator superfamily (MFS) profile domain-containing protein n=1 Tax=Amblyomma americanum TaxID=6943 RepID=A0AAQ4DW95_AMBAM
MLASALFVPLAGIVSDRVGRKPAVMASAIAMLLATLGAGSSHSFSLFLLARFVVSATASATNLLVFIVLYEVTGNERRALYSLLATCIGPTVTPTMLHLLSLLQPSWKVSQTFLATTTAFVVAWCYCLEESPVWLLATWKLRQAELVMLQAARYNGVDLAKAQFTFEALKKQLEKVEMTATTASTGRESGFYVTTFRRRALSVLVSWFGVSFAYYGTALRKSQMQEQWEVSGLLLKTALFATVYDSMTRRGQRATLSGVLALLCASSALQTAVVEWNIAHAIPLSTIALEGASAAAMGVNYSYTTEVFATTIRSMGLCVSYSVGRVGVLLASFLVYVAHGRPSSWFHLTTTLVVYVSAMAIQWLPEIFIHQKGTPTTATMTQQGNRESLKMPLHQRRGAKKSSPSTSSGRAESKTSSPGTEFETQASPTGTSSYQSFPQQQASPKSQDRAEAEPRKTPKHKKGRRSVETPRSA